METHTQKRARLFAEAERLRKEAEAVPVPFVADVAGTVDSCVYTVRRAANVAEAIDTAKRHSGLENVDEQTWAERHICSTCVPRGVFYIEAKRKPSPPPQSRAEKLAEEWVKEDGEYIAYGNGDVATPIRSAVRRLELIAYLRSDLAARIAEVVAAERAEAKREGAEKMREKIANVYEDEGSPTLAREIRGFGWTDD